MTEVTLTINNRGYGVTCDSGQERRLMELSHYVDSRLKDIAAAGAAENESHLLVLTALVMADEIFELRDQVENLRYQRNVPAGQGANPQEEEIVVQAIDHLADRINHITQKLRAAA